MTRPCSLLSLIALLWLAAPAAAATKVDYGPISHKGLKKLGAASKSTKLTLQLGLVAEPVRAPEGGQGRLRPGSSSYGKYPSLSTLASKYGGSSSKRKGVVNAFKKQNVKATVDVTHLRVSATAIDRQGAEAVRHEVGGLQGEVGRARRAASQHAEAAQGDQGQRRHGRRHAAAAHQRVRERARFDGGTPTRTGTPALGCTPGSYPSAAVSGSGLFPNQILTAYGIAPLQAAGLQGQGVRLAIVGEAPTPAVRRQRVPLLLRHPGDAAQDP